MVKINKLGITLVELLGAIVISGIAFSLMALMLTMINQSTSSILLKQKMNTEGMFIVKTIENRLSNFSPTDLDFCEIDAPCVLLINARDINLIDQVIVETKYDPPLLLQLSFQSGKIYFNEEVIYTNEITISETSTIEIIQNQLQFIIILNIVLVSPNGQLFDFLGYYTFQKDS